MPPADSLVDSSPGRRYPRLAWPAVFLALLLCGAAWALAAPYDAPPDEMEHVARAVGVVHGEVLSKRSEAGQGTGAVQSVPASLLRGTCFQMLATKSAACQPEPGGDSRPLQYVTRAGRYNPVYYAIVGWPLRWWPNWAGILVARLITAAMVAGLLTAALHSAVRSSANRGMVAGLLVATTPLVFHLAGAINPAGVEIAAGVLLFAAAIPMLDGRGRLEPVLIRRVGIAAVILATLRSLGPVWLALALGVLLVPSSRALVRDLWRSVRIRAWAVGGLAAVAAGMAWTVGMHAADLIRHSVDVTFAQAVKNEVITRWPTYVEEMVGKMSWNDTYLPSVSYLVWYGALGALVFVALAFTRWVDRWRLFAITAGVFAVPTLSDAVNIREFGYASQGRYMLPLAVGLPLLAAYLLGAGRGATTAPGASAAPVASDGLGAPRIASLTRVLAVALLPIHLVALWTTMVRWQRGLSMDGAFFPTNPLGGAWLPVLGPKLPLLAMVAALAILFVACWRVTRSHPGASASAPAVLGEDRQPAPVGG